MRLDFLLILLPDAPPVSGFFHMGAGERAKAGPRSKFWRAWVIANGAPPRKRQTLSRSIFKGKIFEVLIGDVTKTFDGREHPSCGVYSTVKEILKRIYP